MINDVNPIEEHRLDRGLPWPYAQGVVTERCIVGVQNQRGAAVEMARFGISTELTGSLGLSKDFGMKHRRVRAPLAPVPRLSPATVA